MAAALSASAQCFFSLNPPSASFPSTGGNGLVNITANNGSCARTASSNSPWITISYGNTGTGSGTVGYTVQPNPTANARTGSLTIAGQSFSVTESGAVCNISLSPQSASILASGGDGSFSVSTPCAWSAGTTANWITITSGASGTGDGTVTFTAAANTSGATRSASISVGNVSFNVSQGAPCSFTLSSSGTSYSSSGGTGTFTLTASSNSCERTATSDSPWITISSGQSGTGNGTVSYTVAANTGADTRSGSITVAGQSFVIVQFGGSCGTYTLSPPSATVPVGGSAGTFSVLTSCAWTATSKNDWVTVLTGASATGNGMVTYSVGSNTGPAPRNGSISLGTQGFNIFQPGFSCDITISPDSATIASAGDSGSVTIMASDSCDWSAVSTVAWIKLTSTPSGKGEGTLTYTVLENTGSASRSGTILIGKQIFRITQSSVGCSVALAANTLNVPATRTVGSLDITATCAWRASSNVGWIQITSALSGTSSGTLAFTVSPNPGPTQRVGTIAINGQVFTVTQSGSSCSISLTATSGTLPPSGGSGTLTVNGGPACSWTPSSSDAWLKLTWAAVSGSGTITYTATANTTGADRSTTITVSGQTATITQAPAVVQITAAGIVNAASFAAGPVVPGELVTIFGTGFGPSMLTTLQLTTNKQAITSALGETRVLFDGAPAPMVYTSDGQLSAIVPYAVFGKTTTQVQVEYQGLLSNALSLNVALASPAIFTVNSSGTGPGAVLNQNFSVNSASNPAARNTIVQIYATGEGQTTPLGSDGKLAVAPLPKPILPVTVSIGGVDAPVTYAGAAPGLIAGVIQINARVPTQVQPGDSVPVVVKIGTVTSQTGVTIAVR